MIRTTTYLLTLLLRCVIPNNEMGGFAGLYSGLPVLQSLPLHGCTLLLALRIRRFVAALGLGRDVQHQRVGESLVALQVVVFIKVWADQFSMVNRLGLGE